MIWFGRKETLAKRAKRISKKLELWNIFPKEWHTPEYWWEPFRFYMRFIVTISIPRRWYPHRSDGYGLCSYCLKVKWIEDRPINNRCNECREWVERVEQVMREELNDHQKQLWDSQWQNTKTPQHLHN